MNPVPEAARLLPSSTRGAAAAERAATWTTDGDTRSKIEMAEASYSDNDPRGSMLRGVVEAKKARSVYGWAAMMTNNTNATAKPI
jgi:hypothetical protein